MEISKMRIVKWLWLYASISILAGCASVPDGDRDPRDPWESYNRTIYEFNTGFDETVFIPIAENYRAITPEPIDRGITNFFGNLRDVKSALNNLLQLKFTPALSDVGRVTLNSTVGLLGFVDIASKLGSQSYKEDFGQTLGYWGIGPGPYVVLPILGPSSLRDYVSLVPDWYSQPNIYLVDDAIRWGTVAIYPVDLRADLLEASKTFAAAALDPYIFTRDAYLQKRNNDVYDGNPPEDQEAVDDGDAGNAAVIKK